MDHLLLSPDNGKYTRISPELAGVSETMLWSLYNRASEAGRTGGVLRDPDGLRIQQAIDYDFAGRNGELAVKAGQIVSKRMALGAAAAFDPLAADHAEFGRMVPEKLEAFSAAGTIMLRQSGTANLRVAKIASDAVASTASAAIEIAACRSPASLVRAQGRYAFGWFDQMASGLATLGLLALEAQNAAMTPIWRTVAANAERLGA